MRRTRTQVQTTTWLAHPIHGQLADTLHWTVPEHLGMPTPRFSNTGDAKAGGFSPVRVHDLYLHKSDQTVSPAENPRGAWALLRGYLSCGGEDKEISKQETRVTIQETLLSL